MSVNSINPADLIQKVRKIEEIKTEHRITEQQLDKLTNNRAVMHMSESEYKTLMKARP